MGLLTRENVRPRAGSSRLLSKDGVICSTAAATAAGAAAPIPDSASLRATFLCATLNARARRLSLVAASIACRWTIRAQNVAY